MRVGLTGGIASGKSTVSRIFRKLGAQIIDADQIAHEAILKGKPAYQKIVRIFGKEILKKSGEINRSRLGKEVFSDPEKLNRLNGIVHPEVFREERTRERIIRKGDPRAMILFDVPLLIESGAYLKMDKIIVVYARKETRLQRLMRRDRLSKAESLRRIKSQMPLSKKKEYADFLINGEEPVDRIREKAKKIIQLVWKSEKKQDKKVKTQARLLTFRE